jgi:hypothetical protein
MQGTSSVVISVPAASMALMIASITGTARPGIVSSIAPETAPAGAAAVTLTHATTPLSDDS